MAKFPKEIQNCWTISKRSEKCRGRYCTLLYLVRTKRTSELALLLLGKAEPSDP